MRILQVTNGYPPTASAGVEIYTATISRQLAHSHAVFVFTREGGTDLPDASLLDEEQAGVQIRRVVNNFQGIHHFNDFYRNAEIEAHFRNYVTAVRPDIIHFQHCIGLSIHLLAIARELGIPHLMTLHDYWFLCYRIQLLDAQGARCNGPLKGVNCRRCAWWPMAAQALHNPVFIATEALVRQLPPSLGERAARPLTDMLLRNPEGNAPMLPLVERAWHMKSALLHVPQLLTPSEYVRQRYIAYGLPAERIRALPLGLDLTPWQSAAPRTPRTPNAPFRVGYIGTLYPHKGVHTLVEAVALLPSDLIALTLYGYGDDESPYISELQAQARQNVTFAGRYDNRELPTMLANLDAIVIPSLWDETFSIVAREALLGGVPVLASRLGALPELISEGEFGLLFPPGDSETLASRLGALATGSMRIVPDRAQVGAQIWSVERHVAELERMYQQRMAGLLGQ